MTSASSTRLFGEPVPALAQGQVDAGGGAPAAQALLARACADDREALRALYDRFAPAIRRFLHGLTGDLTAADDGTQETFVRAFQRLRHVRPDEPFAPWLFGIARNVSCEQRRGFRRDGRYALRAVDDAPHEQTCGAPSPEAMLLGRETAEIMRRALAGLSEERRAVLLLRVDHDLSYEELASVMSWSLAKTKVEVHRARVALRADIAKYGSTQATVSRGSHEGDSRE